MRVKAIRLECSSSPLISRACGTLYWIIAVENGTIEIVISDLCSLTSRRGRDHAMGVCAIQWYIHGSGGSRKERRICCP